jgi:hypothetical protein
MCSDSYFAIILSADLAVIIPRIALPGWRVLGPRRSSGAHDPALRAGASLKRRSPTRH